MVGLNQPYNFERLLFYLSNGNHKLVNELYSTMEATSQMDIPKELHERLQAEFQSAVVKDDELCRILQHVRTFFDYWADPHTGVAFGAAHKLGYIHWKDSVMSDLSSPHRDRVQRKDRPVAILATASPCKFEETMTVALGKDQWKEYRESKLFPPMAENILQSPDQSPIIYEVQEGNTLEENQMEWESRARALIETL